LRILVGQFEGISDGEENKHLKQNARHLATVTGEHLKQKWFLTLLTISEKSP